MSSATKNRVLLGIISLLVVSQVSLALMAQTQDGNAWTNFPGGRAKLLKDGDIEDWRFDRHYGTHQWIADSAIRIIYDENRDALKNSVGSKYWFYDPNIHWDRFDCSDSSSHKGDWATTEYITLSGLKDPYSKWKNDKNGKYYAWKEGRRYIRYLHGSFWPDNPTSDLPKISPVKTCPEFRNQFDAGSMILLEERSCAKRLGYTKGAHNVHFINKYVKEVKDGDDVIGYDVDIDGFESAAKTSNAPALRSAKGACDSFLEHMGNKQKTELALFQLGSMTHFIADLANPCHCTYSKGEYLKEWISYGEGLHPKADRRPMDKEDIFSVVFSDSGYGKPDWGKVDPTDYNISLSKKGTRPERAALEMAKYTIETTKEYMVENENEFLSHKYHEDFSASWTKYNIGEGKFDELFKDLLAHAVYYCAEAVTYALKQSDAKYLDMNPLPNDFENNHPLRDADLEALDTDKITNWVEESEVTQDGAWEYYRLDKDSKDGFAKKGEVVAVLWDDDGNVTKAALVTSIPALAAEIGDGNDDKKGKDD